MPNDKKQEPNPNNGGRATIYLSAQALKIYRSIPPKEKSQAISAALIAMYGDGADAARAKLTALLMQVKE